MEDSFFGFDTSAPLDEDGGGRIAEPSEEEYDALNDETFGAAINGDWEEVHENLVRLTDNHNGDTTDNASGGSGRRSRKQNSRGLGLFDGNHQLSSASSSSAGTLSYLNSHRNKNELDSDLELNLAGMKLDDVDIKFDDSDSIMGNSGLSMDPSVWATIPLTSHHNNNKSSEPDKGHSVLYPSPFQQQREHQQQALYQQNNRFSKEMPPFLGGMAEQDSGKKGPKISTLEDIERNIIIQQAMQKQQLQQHQHQQQKQQQQQHQQTTLQEQQVFKNLIKQTPKSPTPVQQSQHQTNIKPQQQTTPKGPPGFNQLHATPRPPNNFSNNLAQHPLGNLLQQQHQTSAQGNRLPPGFPALTMYPPVLAPHMQAQNHAPQLPPHPLLNQHPLPPNFSHPHQRSLPNPHLPIALNNFAMHPNFNAMRAAAAAAGIHPAALVPPPLQQPRLPPHPNVPPNASSTNSMFNMFNMRLMQEIQQNHPLLQNAARQQQPQHLAASANALNSMHLLHHQHQQQQQHRGGMLQKLQNHHQYQHHKRPDGSGGAYGNLPPEEFDEYANLMSTRDKHWLIGIQLSQLNTDTPYIDDFYYTEYTERKAHLNGDMRQSKTHKDNQLNHPLTQPRGHAQLILVQLGNKNGTRSNGQHRERRSSESTGNNGQEQPAKPTYIFTPLKFENSLGKLQYGSVTAPRKIIDADIMSSESSAGNDATDTNSSNADSASTFLSNTSKPSAAGGTVAQNGISEVSSTQRKSRHILLHIETLFRIILKLEDLDNPNAIATIIMKKRKENERILALEQLENANKTSEERAAEINNPQPSLNPAMKNRFAYEIETKEALVAKLTAGLAHDKIVAMMNVRKGKALLRRIMPYLYNNEIRWNVWIGVFASLQNVVKKDREDADGILYALYPEFKKQLQTANFETTVKLATSIPLNDKKSNGVFCSKFGISAVVCLILQAEMLYVLGDDATLDAAHKDSWRKFLDQVATSLNRTIQNHTICAAIESDSIQPMMNHFARFKELKLDSLLALITEAKQQIN